MPNVMIIDDGSNRQLLGLLSALLASSPAGVVNDSWSRQAKPATRTFGPPKLTGRRLERALKSQVKA